MRIRTQLIVAAFLLAVVPLAVIVTYSYHSSRRALEKAYSQECDAATKQMDRRLASIRADLDQRLTFVSALPMSGNTPAHADVGTIVSALGDAAPLVDALEFHPFALQAKVAKDAARAKERAEQADAAQSASAAPAAHTAATRVVVQNDARDSEAPKPGESAEGAPARPATPNAPSAPMEPVVIDIPDPAALPRYQMSAEQQELLGEIASLSSAMQKADLTAQERLEISRHMKEVREQLRPVLQRDRQALDKQLDAAMRERHEKLAAMRAQAQHEREQAAALDAALPVPAAVPVPAVPPTTAVASVPAAPAVTAAASLAAPAVPALPPVRPLTQVDTEATKAREQQMTLILGRHFDAPVRKAGEVVGQITARISADQVVQRILGGVTEERTEVPFAVDRNGTLYTRSAAEKKRLESLGIASRVSKAQSVTDIPGWIVSTSTDPQSGLRIGVAKPVGENLDDLRRTAAGNFAIGLGLIAFALIGIVPLSNRLSREVNVVTAGAEQIAQGDLMTRVPVRTKSELGQLARAFNKMAEDLSIHQQRLIEQERLQKERELEQRLLSMEYERKSVELEEARRFQLSMLPKSVPEHPRYQVAVFTRTATEVGGDYYDFRSAGRTMAVTIGDATGHGAKAGTMVTVVKTLFAGYDGGASPAAFLQDAAEKIKRMDLGRMAMALSLARFDDGQFTVSSAGMPPALVHRAATSGVDEIAFSATPLGTLGMKYVEQTVMLEAGDTVLFMSDGFPELMNDAGAQLGYAGALEAFARAARAGTAGDVVSALASEAAEWHGDTPPNDDVTFVAIRVV